jgi:hypothetical protein
MTRTMTTDAMYQELAGLAARVTDAETDPEQVPSRRRLAATRIGEGSLASRESLALRVREAYPLENARELLSGSIESLEGDEYWTQTALLEELREALDRFGIAARSVEPSSAWAAFDAYQHCVQVLERMYRRLEREALDDGWKAATFVVRELAEIDDDAIARLLAEEPGYVADLRHDTDRSEAPPAPWDEARATLVAQLVFDLQETATPQAVVDWFSFSRSELGETSALETIDRLGTYEAGRLLRDLVRRGRAQVAT